MPMKDIEPEGLDGILSDEGRPVAVDFYTDWCGPCKLLEPRLAQLARDYEGRARVVSMDAEKASGLVQELGIQCVPTVVFFKDGDECDRITGLVPYDELAESMNELL